MHGNETSILFVDDDQNLLNSMERTLRHEPYQILTAGSADEAASKLVREPIAGIICDFQMPGMTGLDFLTHVSHEYPHVFRILLTGNPSVELAMRAINEAGVFRFFAKPVNVVDLAISIREGTECLKHDQGPRLLEEARIQQRLERTISGVRDHKPMVNEVTST